MNQTERHERGNLIIRASAGTGKTFQLAHRFIALLHDGAAADRVLATTFTRKAAGEILDRVVIRLAEAVVTSAARREMGSFIDAPDVSRDACLAMLAGMLSRLYRLRISTLDSFFIQMAQTQTLELGLPPNWRIAEPMEDDALRDDALEAMFRAGSTNELVALTHLLTKGEASRGIGALVQSTVADLHELFLETDEAAWKSLAYRPPLDDVQLEAASAELAALALNGKALSKARDEDVERVAAGDWPAFIDKGIAAKVASCETTYRRQTIPDEVIAIYQQLIEHARSVLIQRVARQTEGSYQLLAAFDREYRGLQQRQRILRFADVTRALGRQPAAAATATAATTSPANASPADASSDASDRGELDRMAFRLDGAIDHVLLDEFQDTAPDQWRAIRRLAEHVCVDDPRRSFFCVGDVKQAIYGWRGGVAEIFQVVGDQLPGLAQSSLNRSFRSSPPVIEAVNQVFTRLNSHPNLGRAAEAVKIWSERFEQHQTARTDLPGYVTLQTAPAADEDEDQGEVLLDFAAAEAARIRRESRGASVGILVRTNRSVGALIARLRRLQVPASEEGGNPITDAAAVQLILSLLRLADHPSDTVSRFHVATSPLGSALQFEDAFDATAAHELATRIRRTLLDRGYGPSILEWSRVLAPNCNAREQRRIDQLVDLAYLYESDATLRADDFVRFVDYQRVSEPAAATVRVMTIHQAKGLEFDVVLLPELEARLLGQPASFVVHRPDPTQPADRVCRYANESLQRLLPSDVQQMFADAARRSATESLCVLYVAMTRAVHGLHLLISPSAPNERTISATFAGLLRTALFGTEPARPGERLFEHGDPRWFEQLPQTATPALDEEPATSAGRGDLPARVTLAAETGLLRRGARRTSPSSLEGGSRVRIEAVLASRKSVALMRGSIVHAWFELIEWLDDGPPDVANMHAAAQQILDAEGSSGELNIEQLAKDFRAMMARPEVTAALQRRTMQQRAEARWPDEISAGTGDVRMTVENERAFAVRDDDCMLTGSIDRYVSIYRGSRLVAVDLLDFKTDAVKQGDAKQLAERLGHYRPQLEAYRRAVSTMTGLPGRQVAARLLFVGPGVVRDV